jgi:glycosyltransferase involved in cell wall biosynthesis
LGSYIAWPDETVGWLPFALAAAHRAARSWRPDVILSSSYPYTSHLIALAVSRSIGVPWVADFRDPWMRNPQSERLPPPLPQLSARTEGALVRRADRVIVVDRRLELIGLEPDDPRRVIIRNGVDETDFLPEGAEAVRPPADRFRLTDVGSLYGTRDAAPVFEAIRRLVRNGVIDPNRFEVSLVGNVWLGDRTVELGSVRVTRTGYVHHVQAVQEMRSATALLFYAPASTWAPSGKLFEYLASGRPILSIARRDNLAFEVVNELRAGATAEPDDAKGIDCALTDLYTRWASRTLEIGPEIRERALERFSRRGLTSELARVLEAAIEATSRR